MKQHDKDIVIHPIRTKKEKPIPKNGLILVNPVDAQYGFDFLLARDAEERRLHNSGLCVAKENDFFIAGPAIGAPVAVMTIEKLIALGAEHIFFYGWCGAIDPNLAVGDLIIPTRALSGEGTSKYYQTNDKQKISPSATLVAKLFDIARKQDLSPLDGAIWTTDAPYRESKRYLRGLHENEKISGVDMEFSALCSVASFRKVKFAAVMLISDEIWAEKWSTGFSKKTFRDKSRLVIELILKDKMLRESCL